MFTNCFRVKEKVSCFVFCKDIWCCSVLIIADHIMIMNATDGQVFNMTRSAPPPPTTTTNSTAQSSTTMESQHGLGLSSDAQNQMIQKFSQQSGMIIEYSKLLVFVFHWQYIDLLYFVIYSCLSQNQWNYDKAAQNFQDLLKTVCLFGFLFVKLIIIFFFYSEFNSTWSFQETLIRLHNRQTFFCYTYIFLYLLVCSLLFLLLLFKHTK